MEKDVIDPTTDEGKHKLEKLHALAKEGKEDDDDDDEYEYEEDEEEEEVQHRTSDPE